MKTLPPKERLEDAIASVLARVQDELLSAIAPIVEDLARERIAELLAGLTGKPPPYPKTLGCTARDQGKARRA